MMLFRLPTLAAALLAVGLLVGSGASAAPIWSDDNTGVTTQLAPGSGAYVVNLWLDVDGNAVSAAGFVVQATGSITFTAPVSCLMGNCSATPTFPNQGPQSGSVNFGVDQLVDFQLANLTINVGAGAGQLLIVSANWDNDLLEPGSPDIVTPFVLVNAVPEPGTLLLLGSGLVGLVVAGRRS